MLEREKLMAKFCCFFKVELFAGGSHFLFKRRDDAFFLATKK